MNLDDLPPTSTRRNDLPSLEDLVDMALTDRAIQGKPLREVLLRFGMTLLQSLEFRLGKAAERGIEQALQVVTNPQFYADKRRRRQAWRNKMQQEREENRKSRFENLKVRTRLQ